VTSIKCPSNPSGKESYIVRKVEGNGEKAIITELPNLASSSFSKTGRLIMQYAQTLKSRYYVTGRGSTEGYSVYDKKPEKGNGAKILFRLIMVRTGNGLETAAIKGKQRINRVCLISPDETTETAQTTETQPETVATTETILPTVNESKPETVTLTVAPELTEKEVMAANKARAIRAAKEAKKNGK